MAPAGTRAPRSGAAARGFALALAAAGLAAAPPARAQGPSAVDVSAARTLGQEGSRLADEGHCEQAIEKLERAERLYHAPTLLGRLGECQIGLGQLLRGVENLQRVVREPLPAGAPLVFAAAKVRAQKVLDQSLPLLAHLRIDVRAGADARPTIKVDGEDVPAARLDAERPTDPGERLVEVSAPGYVKVVRKVKLAPGESLALTITLEPSPALARSPVAGGAPRAPDAAAGGGPSPWAYVALGVGAAGVVGGAVLGATTLSRKSDLEDECPGGACPSAEHQRDIDAMKRTGNLSTLAFAVGGVGLGAGALLWWLGPSRPDAKRAGAGLTLGAWASGSSAGLRGSFP